uniref:Uncharacterized protein n=1 Tax=Anguilla anguilla TaxID=7936 RepID=A0A0E9S8X1_ANGAN
MTSYCRNFRSGIWFMFASMPIKLIIWALLT